MVELARSARAGVAGTEVDVYKLKRRQKTQRKVEFPANARLQQAELSCREGVIGDVR